MRINNIDTNNNKKWYRIEKVYSNYNINVDNTNF